MNRRRYLHLIGAGSLAGFAGCLSSGSGGSDPATTTGTAESGTTTTRAGDGASANVPDYSDVDLPIPREELNRGAPKDRIPAITEPSFGPDWGETEFELANDDRVIGVSRDGESRAYPLRILNWHEIVNDEFGGPLLVSFCPLCGSGLTAERTVRGEPTLFGVSGLLYQSDLVMYDVATDSLWSQIMATAINGELTGEQLTIVPSTLTTWGAWTADHPDTGVLLPPPASGTISDAAPRSYGRNPYSGYDSSRRIGIGYNDVEDDRLHPKTEVIGITDGDAARAYPFETVLEEGVINDTVGDKPVVVSAADDTLVAYDRRVDGETLTFEESGDRRMAGGGSTWKVLTGEAVDGPHEGIRLDQASHATSMFWFAWVDFNPDTDVYGN